MQISLMISALLQILTIPVTTQTENFPPTQFHQWHFSACTYKHTVFLYMFRSMEILSCRMLSCTRPFHNRYCVQWHSKSDSCSKASILSSLSIPNLSTSLVLTFLTVLLYDLNSMASEVLKKFTRFPKHDTYWQLWVDKIQSYLYGTNCICAELCLWTLFILK
jgi:hypothetical protein